jgi:tRNA 2-selenouridine synthase
VQDTSLFGERLDLLRELRGRAVVDGWKARAASGDVAGVVHELLELHYDPLYAASTRRNFQRQAQARTWQALRAEDMDGAALARAIIEETP